MEPSDQLYENGLNTKSILGIGNYFRGPEETVYEKTDTVSLITLQFFSSL